MVKDSSNLVRLAALLAAQDEFTRTEPEPEQEKPCRVCGKTEGKPIVFRGEPYCCGQHKEAS